MSAPPAPTAASASPPTFKAPVVAPAVAAKLNVAASSPAASAAASSAPAAAAAPIIDMSHKNLTPAEKKAWTSKQIMIAMTSVLLAIVVILSIVGLVERSLLTSRLGQREKDEVEKSSVFDGINMVFWTSIILALIAIAVMYVFVTGKIHFPDGKDI